MYQIGNGQIAPELRGMGRVVRTLMPSMKESTFRKANVLLKATKGKGAKGLSYRQVHIAREAPAAAGDKLRLCVYQPLEPQPGAPGFLWLHGGGYCIGTPEMDAAFARELIGACGCTVVAPDYRLAVDAPYPAALQDCYAALRWMRDNAGQLGIRTDQLMVGGESAGGGLAAALCIYARDRGEVAIAFQLPLYPMLDDRMVTPSSRDNDAPFWNTRSNEEGWRLYLGELYRTDDVPAYAAPGRLADFAGLPPAYTFVGDIEPFHDEVVLYMEALKQAGVAVEYDEYQGCYHGFDVVCPKAQVTLMAHARMREHVAYAAGHYFKAQP